MATPIALVDLYAMLNDKGTRLRLPMERILDELQASLPPLLVDLGLPRIRGFYIAGEKMQEAFPAIVVASSWNVEEFGTNHKADGHIMVSVVYQKEASRREMMTAHDLINCVAAVLTHHTNMGPKREDVAGVTRTVWTYMVPTGFTLVPENWPHYSGVIFQLLCTLTPKSNQWI